MSATPAPTIASLPSSTVTAQATPALTSTSTHTADRRFAFVEEFAPLCEVLLDNIPEIAQQRNLSCEAACIRMVLEAWGIKASEDEILARMGIDENPHVGFRGNVDGPVHSPDLSDYGTYAEVVERVLASFGVAAETVYGMTNDQLRQTVKSGSAVIVWMSGESNPAIIHVEREGERFVLVEGEHTYVVIGISKDGRFVIHDPWGAKPGARWPGTRFVSRIFQWDLFDRMAVVVPIP